MSVQTAPTSDLIRSKIEEVNNTISVNEVQLKKKGIEFNSLSDEIQKMEVSVLLGEVPQQELDQKKSNLETISKSIIKHEEIIKVSESALVILKDRLRESESTNRKAKSNLSITAANQLIKNNNGKLLELESIIQEINEHRINSISILAPGDNDLYRGRWDVFLTDKRRAEFALRELKMFFELEERVYLHI